VRDDVDRVEEALNSQLAYRLKSRYNLLLVSERLKVK
jgi:hypothetical protein